MILVSEMDLGYPRNGVIVLGLKEKANVADSIKNGITQSAPVTPMLMHNAHSTEYRQQYGAW